MRKHRLLYKLGLSILTIVVVVSGLGYWLLNRVEVSASNNFVSLSVDKTLSQQQIKANALDTYSGSTLSEKSTNQFEVDYAGTGSKITIGDSSPSKSSNFKPDLTVSQWNGEAEFKLIAPVDVQSKELATSLDSASKDVTASNSDWQFEYKTTEPKEGFNEFGGLDMIITAKSKPSSNQIRFTYDSTTVTPYLQPPLTEEWKEGDKLVKGTIVGKVTETDVYDDKDNLITHRPDYVVGSLAFYANGERNYIVGGVNYGTGRVGMLYAMQCQGQWCRWSIDKDEIVLTIPQELIDKDTYPLIIEPLGDTFGYTTLGSSDSNNYADTHPFLNMLLAYNGEAPAADGTGTSMSIGARCSSGTATVIMALYTHAGALVANSGTSAISVNSNTKQWWTGTNSPTLLASTYYHMAQMGDATWSANGYWAYDSSGKNMDYNASGSYSTWPATWTHTTTKAAVFPSIYVTYSTAGTYNLTNDPSSKDFGVVQPSATIQAGGGAYSNPVTDGQCTFTITNSQANAIKVSIKATNFTGGGGWTLGAPDGTHARLTAVVSGVNPASGVVLTTSDQTLIASLAGSATNKWDLQLETPTSMADGNQKSTTITLTGSVP